MYSLQLRSFVSGKEPMGGTLQLKLTDVYGDFLNEPVDMVFQNQTLDDVRRVIHQKPNRLINVTSLNSGPQGLYAITVEPMSFHLVSQFVRYQQAALSHAK